ncbi:MULTISPECIES: hypothetical protein [Streptomyces]|uniref:hypothetical protein n=1 Tax=Streptomyces TaxID=1883 RepID=UPI0029BF66AD|nr:hypothetical protein [Streptomyces stelliscabiei]MDX2520579.1 hypothetical protein [Streptomyces stelliscabiei]MDX2552676.1 hypothetical protein [Streptomyces stelliscabiei]MDX2661360.1 hypothetical protein [Streptomyces stelliscabiei]MDX2788841.1 hypothetical protein [Streptomyces stelliscabiei]
MATGQLTVCVRCPACNQPIDLNATLRAELMRNVLGIDTAPIHAHIRQAHPEQAPTTEEPPRPE